MQNMNMQTEEKRENIMKKRKDDLPFWRFTVDVAEYQRQKQKYYVVETPTGSAVWSLPMMAK